MKFHIHKIQCVLPDQTKEEALLKELDVLKKEHQGSLLILTARGTREEILQKVQTQNPIFCEVIPLTLEEIFISETEVAGYEVKNIFWYFIGVNPYFFSIRYSAKILAACFISRPLWMMIAPPGWISSV